MTTSPITSKGQRTRLVILEASMKLFREKGYERTTMRDIAEAADLAVANAYHYFRSKDDLMIAFYERINDEQADVAQAALAQQKTLKDRLITTLRCKLAVLSERRD